MGKTKLFYGCILGKWYEEIWKYRKIIVFDNAWNNYLSKFLSEYKGRKILYIWNPAKELFLYNDIDKIKMIYHKVYSFDKQDCKLYNISYFHSVYTNQIIPENRNIKYDICFMGSDKGRIEELRELYCLFCSYNLKCHFYIYSNQKTEKNGGWEVNDKWITYKEYLEWVFASRCILDLPQEKQAGFTMRVLESVFLNKKLITKNTEIKTSDLYKKQNVFIIGQDEWKKLQRFINSSTQVYEKEILEKYSIQNWAENIG